MTIRFNLLCRGRSRNFSESQPEPIYGDRELEHDYSNLTSLGVSLTAYKFEGGTQQGGGGDMKFQPDLL